MTEGRENIYVLISTFGGRFRSLEYRDLTINMAGDRAEVGGQITIVTEAPTPRGGVQTFHIQEKRSWKLRREPEGWRIYDQETRSRTQTMQ